MVRLARDDVNTPGFDGWLFNKQVREVEFEAAVYKLLRITPQILTPHLLYYHILVQNT